MRAGVASISTVEKSGQSRREYRGRRTQRARHLLATHAGQGFDIHGLQLLRGVEGINVFHRDGHRLLDVVTQAIAGINDFLLGNL
jgi:hypothetical protein